LPYPSDRSELAGESAADRLRLQQRNSAPTCAGEVGAIWRVKEHVYGAGPIQPSLYRVAAGWVLLSAQRVDIGERLIPDTVGFDRLCAS
jgi:hypothetical protein